MQYFSAVSAFFLDPFKSKNLRLNILCCFQCFCVSHLVFSFQFLAFSFLFFVFILLVVFSF